MGKRSSCIFTRTRAEPISHPPARWTPEIFGTKGAPRPMRAKRETDFSLQCAARRAASRPRSHACKCPAPARTARLTLRARSGGMAAPLLGGALLMADAALPVYASAAIFLVAAGAVLLLREHAGARGAAGAPLH